MTGYLFGGGYDWPLMDLIGVSIGILFVVWLAWYVMTRKRRK